jgi:hypothetical protein
MMDAIDVCADQNVALDPKTPMDEDTIGALVTLVAEG